MPAAPLPSERPALFDSPSADVIAAALVRRARSRLDAVPDAAVADLLADTVFHERKRLLESGGDPAYLTAVEAAAHALRDMRRGEMDGAIEAIVATYAREIHNSFSPRTYKFATRVMPGVLTRLLTASRGRDLLFGDVDPASRMCVHGPIDRIRRMASTSTLILAPTHVSNLDSPLLGYALYAAGLPPFAYGAGLNLFSNPAMAFFMERLGAYTVDRRKRNRLYKDTLKDYSIEILRRHCHSLFFPGGTRSRSGRLERHLKKGLLGTGLAAWQENLAEGRPNPDVFIVPCTLSVGLVLEAETLIADSLAEEGKQRYIIQDDEFSDSRQVASFVRRLMRLDAAVHVVFGDPMDIVGNRVDDAGTSLDPHGRPVDRRGYVCDRNGRVIHDEQRDHVYTERVAERLSEAYHRDFVVQPTHLAAWGAWEALRARHQGLDTWRLVRLHPDARTVDRATVLAHIDRASKGIAQLRRVGPPTAEGVLDEAIARFASFHKKRAMEPIGGSLKLDSELILYYRNRLDWIKA